VKRACEGGMGNVQDRYKKGESNIRESVGTGMIVIEWRGEGGAKGGRSTA